MVRLADLPEWEREHLLEKVPPLPHFETQPWVGGPPLAKRRVAIITTAGLHRRGDRAFAGGSTDYRVIPGDTRAALADALNAEVSQLRVWHDIGLKRRSRAFARILRRPRRSSRRRTNSRLFITKP